MQDTNEWFSDEQATFGDRLSAARDKAGMTQKDLAKRMGIKLGTLRNWEDDLAEPRANKLSMVSGLLGVRMSWLLTGEGEGIAPPLDGPPVPDDAIGLMAEMRSLRMQSTDLAQRMGILEKRLRKMLGQDQ